MRDSEFWGFPRKHSSDAGLRVRVFRVEYNPQAEVWEIYEGARFLAEAIMDGGVDAATADEARYCARVLAQHLRLEVVVA